MLSLSYVSKRENGYIMNFYADTEEDIVAFNPTAPFMSYGVPLTGSTITLTSAGSNVNYYLNSEGTLVALSTGGGGGSEDPVYVLNAESFIIDAHGAGAVAALTPFNFNNSDVYTIDVSGADGVSANGIVMVYEVDEKEGNQFYAEVGSGDHVGIMSAYITEDGHFEINAKNKIQPEYFTDILVKIYKK